MKIHIIQTRIVDNIMKIRNYDLKMLSSGFRQEYRSFFSQNPSSHHLILYQIFITLKIEDSVQNFLYFHPVQIVLVQIIPYKSPIGGQVIASWPLASLEVIYGSFIHSWPLPSLETIGGPVIPSCHLASLEEIGGQVITSRPPASLEAIY